MPHLLAADLPPPATPACAVACHACRYLLARGDNRTALGLAGDLRQQWRERFGGDHEHTLEIARSLGWALLDWAAGPKPAT